VKKKANIFVTKFNGAIDPQKAGKFKTLKIRAGKATRETWVQYLATFSRKSDLDRAKKWYQSRLVTHLRTYKTAGGYELWGND
jgi:hypothetical protein